MAKHRQNFYLSDDEMEILKARAEELGQSIGDRKISMSKTVGYLIKLGTLSKSAVEQIKKLS